MPGTALRTVSGPSGYPSWPLQTEAAHEAWGGGGKKDEAAAPAAPPAAPAAAPPSGSAGYPATGKKSKDQ